MSGLEGVNDIRIARDRYDDLRRQLAEERKHRQAAERRSAEMELEDKEAELTKALEALGAAPGSPAADAELYLTMREDKGQVVTSESLRVWIDRYS